MTDVLVHFPEPLEARVLTRATTPRIGDDLADGYVVVRRLVRDAEDGEQFEVWVERIAHGSLLDSRAAEPDRLVVELAGLLQNAGPDERDAILEVLVEGPDSFGELRGKLAGDHSDRA